MELITPGARIREIRKRRGLTQKDLAAAAGVALVTVKRIEQGTYGPVRLAMMRRLAVALDVPTTTLQTEPDTPVPTQGSERQWEPVRLALDGTADGTPGGEPEARTVEDGYRRMVPLLIDGHFAEMGATLPALLRDADALVGISANGARDGARGLRARIRQAAGALMLHAWQFGTAERAFGLAMEDAAGDPLMEMSVVDERCWGLIRQGLLTEAADLAFRWAGEHEPRMSGADREHMALWGRLLIRASAAAIRDNRASEAAEALKLARMAAIGTGPDYMLSRNWHGYGSWSVNVAMAECAMIQDRPDKVLAITRRLDASRPVLRGAPAYLLDMANAHAVLRQDSEAVSILQRLRASRPEWLPRQRYAADILQLLFEHRRTLSAEMRELAQAVRLPL